MFYCYIIYLWVFSIEPQKLCSVTFVHESTDWMPTKHTFDLPVLTLTSRSLSLIATADKSVSKGTATNGLGICHATKTPCQAVPRDNDKLTITGYVKSDMNACFTKGRVHKILVIFAQLQRNALLFLQVRTSPHLWRAHCWTTEAMWTFRIIHERVLFLLFLA